MKCHDTGDVDSSGRLVPVGDDQFFVVCGCGTTATSGSSSSSGSSGLTPAPAETGSEMFTVAPTAATLSSSSSGNVVTTPLPLSPSPVLPTDAPVPAVGTSPPPPTIPPVNDLELNGGWRSVSHGSYFAGLSLAAGVCAAIAYF